MTHTNFMDKYPVYSLELQKTQTELKNVDEILAYFKDKIDNHKIATFIASFDHYTHTKSIDGTINPDIKNAKNIIFCFGAAIPNTNMLAVRPRTIGVAELEKSFMIEFLEAPKADIQELMISWCKDLISK